MIRRPPGPTPFPSPPPFRSDRVCISCLEKEPAYRPSSAADVARALERAMTEGGGLREEAVAVGGALRRAWPFIGGVLLGSSVAFATALMVTQIGRAHV